MPNLTIDMQKQLTMPIDIHISLTHCSKGGFFSIYNS